MAYTKASTRATVKYVKNHQKQIVVKYKKTTFQNVIEPSVQRANLPLATFFKVAVNSRIELENLIREKTKLQCDTEISEFIRNAVIDKLNS